MSKAFASALQSLLAAAVGPEAAVTHLRTWDAERLEALLELDKKVLKNPHSRQLRRKIQRLESEVVVLEQEIEKMLSLSASRPQPPAVGKKARSKYTPRGTRNFFAEFRHFLRVIQFFSSCLFISDFSDFSFSIRHIPHPLHFAQDPQLRIWRPVHFMRRRPAWRDPSESTDALTR
jgi:hypothetical protein